LIDFQIQTKLNPKLRLIYQFIFALTNLALFEYILKNCGYEQQISLQAIFQLTVNQIDANLYRRIFFEIATFIIKQEKLLIL